MKAETKEEFIKKVCNKIKFPQTITNQWIDKMFDEWQNAQNQWDCDWEMIWRWGFCYKDMSKFDLSQLDTKHLSMLTFNSSTIWPESKHMPKGFNPSKILQNGKNPMLGIKDLHSQGITGKGVAVACIDNGFQGKNHIEFKNAKINVKDFANDEAHFHSECALANLLGKNIGVAPDVECYFYSIDQENLSDIADQIVAAFDDIINKINSGIKIKAVSRSGPIFYENINDKQILEIYGSVEAYQKIKNRINKLEKLGCAVVDSGIFGKTFNCCDLKIFKKGSEADNIDFSSWQLSHLDLAKTLVSFVCAGKVVPEFCSNDGYKFEQVSCYSWTIPQAIGMYALCLQVEPNLTWQAFTQLAQQTAKTNKNGVKLANPKEMIKQVDLQKENLINQ